MSFCGPSLLLVLGKFVRVKVPLVRTLYLPTSVVAGVSAAAIAGWVVVW